MKRYFAAGYLSGTVIKRCLWVLFTVFFMQTIVCADEPQSTESAAYKRYSSEISKIYLEMQNEEYVRSYKAQLDYLEYMIKHVPLSEAEVKKLQERYAEVLQSYVGSSGREQEGLEKMAFFPRPLYGEQHEKDMAEAVKRLDFLRNKINNEPHSEAELEKLKLQYAEALMKYRQVSGQPGPEFDLEIKDSWIDKEIEDRFIKALDESTDKLKKQGIIKSPASDSAKQSIGEFVDQLYKTQRSWEDIRNEYRESMQAGTVITEAPGANLPQASKDAAYKEYAHNMCVIHSDIQYEKGLRLLYARMRYLEDTVRHEQHSENEVESLQKEYAELLERYSSLEGNEIEGKKKLDDFPRPSGEKYEKELADGKYRLYFLENKIKYGQHNEAELEKLKREYDDASANYPGVYSGQARGELRDRESLDASSIDDGWLDKQIVDNFMKKYDGSGESMDELDKQKIGKSAFLNSMNQGLIDFMDKLYRSQRSWEDILNDYKGSAQTGTVITTFPETEEDKRKREFREAAEAARGAHMTAESFGMHFVRKGEFDPFDIYQLWLQREAVGDDAFRLLLVNNIRGANFFNFMQIANLWPVGWQNASQTSVSTSTGSGGSSVAGGGGGSGTGTAGWGTYSGSQVATLQLFPAIGLVSGFDGVSQGLLWAMKDGTTMGTPVKGAYWCLTGTKETRTYTTGTTYSENVHVGATGTTGTTYIVNFRTSTSGVTVNSANPK